MSHFLVQILVCTYVLCQHDQILVNSHSIAFHTQFNQFLNSFSVNLLDSLIHLCHNITYNCCYYYILHHSNRFVLVLFCFSAVFLQIFLPLLQHKHSLSLYIYIYIFIFFSPSQQVFFLIVFCFLLLPLFNHHSPFLAQLNFFLLQSFFFLSFFLSFQIQTINLLPSLLPVFLSCSLFC